MPSFSQAASVTVTLDGNDTLSISGSAILRIAPVGLPPSESRTYGDIVYGPYGVVTTITIIGIGSGTYSTQPSLRSVPMQMVDMTAAQIAAPTAAQLAATEVVYQLNAAPYTRYVSNGTNLIAMSGASEIAGGDYLPINEGVAFTPISETRNGAVIPGWVPENLSATGLVCYAPVAAIGVYILASSSGVIELREGSASGRLLTKASLAVSAGQTVFIAGTKGAERLAGDLWFVLVSGTAEVEPLFEAIDGVMLGPDGEDIILDPGKSGLIYFQGPRILGGATVAANHVATVASSIHILVGQPAEFMGLRVIASSSGVINLYEGTGTDGRRILPASTALVAGTNVYPWGDGVLRYLNGGVAMQLVSGTCEVAPLWRPWNPLES